MLYKAFILLLAAAMIGALGASLYFLLKDRGKGRRVVFGLGLRVGLASLLLIFLLLGLATGQLQPTAPWDEVHRSQPAADSR